jgi:hypothetical protein
MPSHCLKKQPIPEVKTSALVFTLRLKDGGSQLRLGSVESRFLTSSPSPKLTPNHMPKIFPETLNFLPKLRGRNSKGNLEDKDNQRYGDCSSNGCFQNSN